jgi:hypothetical protein
MGKREQSTDADRARGRAEAPEEPDTVEDPTVPEKDTGEVDGGAGHKHLIVSMDQVLLS